MNTTLILIIVAAVVIIIAVIVIKSALSNKKTDDGKEDIGKSEGQDEVRTETINALDKHIEGIKKTSSKTDVAIQKHEKNSLSRREKLKLKKEKIDAKKNS